MANTKEDYKHEFFVPKKFVVGIDGHNAGFPSMKNKDGKWTNLSVFEKHCKYKPNTQQDSQKEILKTFSQAVQEVENIPISGFRLLNVSKKVYNTELYKDVSCVSLQDPRGWQICIESSDFQSILEGNKFNIDNGVLADVKLIYCWENAYKAIPFTLKIAEASVLKMQEDTEAFISARTPNNFLTPSQFKVGSIYSSKMSKFAGSLYMYMGVRDVYSADCHYKAIAKNTYFGIESECISDRNDITHPKRHVFYCLDPDYKNNFNEIYLLRQNTPNCTPYCMFSTPSKIFETEETNVDLTKFKLYNDSSKTATFENIKADMETNAAFNKIDLADVSTANVSYDALETLYACVEGKNRNNMVEDFTIALKGWPFTDLCFYSDTISFNSGVGYTMRDFTIELHDLNDHEEYLVKQAKQKNGDYYYYGYSDRRATLATYVVDCHTVANRKAVFKKLFDELKINVKQYKFCNGKNVPEYQNLALNAKLDYYYS